MKTTADAAGGVYGIKDVYLRDGKLYFWLPANANPSAGVKVITWALKIFGLEFERYSSTDSSYSPDMVRELDYMGMFSFSGSGGCAAGTAGGLALAGAAVACLMRRKMRRTHRP